MLCKESVVVLTAPSQWDACAARCLHDSTHGLQRSHMQRGVCPLEADQLRSVICGPQQVAGLCWQASAWSWAPRADGATSSAHGIGRDAITVIAQSRRLPACCIPLAAPPRVTHALCEGSAEALQHCRSCARRCRSETTGAAPS